MKTPFKSMKPTRFGFGEGLAIAGEKFSNLVCLGADITHSVSLNYFSEKFPERFISLGIAEQNCVSVMAGLALSGKIPVFSTYGVFAALRTTDQIRVSLCYNNLHSIIGGAHAGISVGPDGATHQALEDIAIMRSLPNMIVLSPCDATQTKKLTIAAIENCTGPVYIRFGREAVPDFTNDDETIEIGKGQTLIEGNDITLIATGHMVWEAMEASKILKNEGISARVINIHTIKPIDKEIIIKAAKETKGIISCEEHQIMGGLGGAIAEVLVQHHPAKMDFIGMNDSFGQSGTPSELMDYYELTARHIAERCRIFLK
jgi:transketolase